MRRTSLAVVCISAIAMSGFIATPAAAQPTFGIKGGISFGTFTVATETEANVDPGQRQGFVGGLAVLRAGNRAGGVLIEALVHQKGGKDVLRPGDRMRLTYLDVPVLLHLDVLQRGPSALFVTFGPSFAFNLDSTYEDQGMPEDISDDIETFDVGLNLGAGLEAGALIVEARYTWGLRRVFTEGESGAGFKNRALAVTVGFWFR
jgi:hypothetical protein